MKKLLATAFLSAVRVSGDEDLPFSFVWAIEQTQELERGLLTAWDQTKVTYLDFND